MTRQETITLIGAMSGAICVPYLESLSEEQLRSYLIHLKAVKLKSLNDRRRPGVSDTTPGQNVA